jgi:hypothetical protein
MPLAFALAHHSRKNPPRFASVSLLPEFSELFLKQVSTLQRRIKSEAAFHCPAGTSGSFSGSNSKTISPSHIVSEDTGNL